MTMNLVCDGAPPPEQTAVVSSTSFAVATLVDTGYRSLIMCAFRVRHEAEPLNAHKGFNLLLTAEHRNDVGACFCVNRGLSREMVYVTTTAGSTTRLMLQFLLFPLGLLSSLS